MTCSCKPAAPTRSFPNRAWREHRGLSLQALADAAPDDAELRWYEAEHDLDDRARREQLDWLTERLGIVGPPVSGAATGP